MKACLTFGSNLIPAICLVVSLLAIPKAFSQNYVLNGNAVDLGSGCYQLTPQTTNQRGSVWYQNKLSLAFDFTIKADLNFGFIDFNGADGMGFVLQPICNGLGQAGGGLGFGGISPSLAVEFDTYQNSFAPENYNDPFEDHIALQQNGNLKHDSTLNLAGPVIMPNLEDGLDHSLAIAWNAATQTLTVDFDGANVITYTGDIVADIFGGNPEVFWGFTAATGALTNQQSVCINEVNFEELIPYTTSNSSCPTAADGAIDLMLTGGIGPFTFLWSNSDTTEDLTGIPAGAYTVLVTDANGCVSTYTVEVQSDPDTIAPVLTCPADINVSTDPGVCSAVVTYDVPAATDNCLVPVVSMDSGLGSGASFPKGTTKETYTATDGSGLTATCSFTITVTDMEPPVIICPPDTLVPCNVPEDLPGAGTASATDNCDAAPVISYSDTVVSGDCNWECLIERTWTATDAQGNSSACVQMITKSVLPVIQGALSADVDGDGAPDPVVLGYSRHTVSIGYDAAACVVGWLPGDTAPATAIPKKGNHVVDPADCLPGPVALSATGKLADPLMEYTLLLAIKLRLDPDFGKTPLSAIACDMHPIVFQYMKNDPTVDDLLLLGNIALGNIIGPPHLEHIKDALACIAGTFSLCDPPSERPESVDQVLIGDPVHSILELGAGNLELFPNPAFRSISLHDPGVYGHAVRIAVYSAQGRLIRKIQVPEMPSGPYTIDLTGQPAGLYWIELNAGNGSAITAKFILSGL